MIYFSSDNYNKEFAILKFMTSYYTKALKRNVKYDDVIDKFPMPNRVAYPLYTNSTGLNMKHLGKPREKFEKLIDALEN